MKRTTLIAGLTAFSIGAAALSTGAFADGNDGKGRHHGPRFDFDQVDTNSDGKITAEEMQAYQAARFADVDTDGDGKISSEELSAHVEEGRMERAEKRIESMIERMDTDGDGVLSTVEMAPKDADKMFERLDTDGDGAVSKEELEARKGGKGGKDRGHGKKDKRSN